MSKFNLTRRGFGFFSAGAATLAGSAPGSLNPSPGYPASWSSPPSGYGGGMEAQTNVPDKPPTRLMSQTSAVRKIFQQFPEIRKIAESSQFEATPRTVDIDHDIDVHRSFSKAAKICYQRQRIVARNMAGLLHEEEETWVHKTFKPLLDKFMWGDRTISK